MTVTEIVVVSAILGILAVPMAMFISSTLKNVTRSNLQIKSQDDLRSAFDELERDFMEMNEVSISSQTTIQFTMDSYQNPGYNPNGDQDGDGIVNLKDSDDDNDVTTIMGSTSAWRVGYDLKDDDEDNNGQIDVQCRYYLSGTTLCRDFNYNGAGWGLNVRAVASSVSTLNFTYYGSKNEDLGRLIDLGNDGTASTGDTGESDGIITAREIDWVQAGTGHGNRSGSINTADERKYIVSIYVLIAQDLNKDGREDFRMETQIAPPLLPVKRRY